MQEALEFKHIDEASRNLSKEVNVIWSRVTDRALPIPMETVRSWVEECVCDLMKNHESVAYRISGDTCVLVMLEEETDTKKFYSVEVCKRVWTAYTKV